MSLSFIKNPTISIPTKQQPILPTTADDDASVQTKNTQLTTGTTSSRKTIRSAANKRKKIAAERRIFIRDVYANLLDVVGDWAFFLAVYNYDFDANAEAEVQTQYRLIIHAIFALVMLSTILVSWFMVSAVWAKTGRGACCNCTPGRIVLTAIVLQDIPQILCTLYVDNRFMGGMSAVGMLNICSSLNAVVNRLTAYYEDVKEEVFVIVDSYKNIP